MVFVQFCSGGSVRAFCVFECWIVLKHACFVVWEEVLFYSYVRGVFRRVSCRFRWISVFPLFCGTLEVQLVWMRFSVRLRGQTGLRINHMGILCIPRSVPPCPWHSCIICIRPRRGGLSDYHSRSKSVHLSCLRRCMFRSICRRGILTCRSNIQTSCFLRYDLSQVNGLRHLTRSGRNGFDT